MSLVKTTSRKIVFPLVTGLGVEKLLSGFSANEHLILCYHGCTQFPDFSINGRHIASKQLEEHFIYLKHNFNILSLDEMFRVHKENKKSDKKSIAITFDDGYLNNYTTIFPLIKKYNIPAIFFILSKPLVDDNFINWPDIIDIVKKYSDRDSLQIGNAVFKRQNKSNFFSETLNISVSDHIKKMGIERDEILSQLMVQCEFDKIIYKANSDYYKFINQEQLKEMGKNNLIEIGSHSHSHYNLGNISAALVREELTKSKKILEDVIGQEVKTVAFPDGSYNDEVKNISKSIGYKNLLAVSYQCEGDKRDKSILPRLTISNTTTHESCMIHVNLGFWKRGF